MSGSKKICDPLYSYIHLNQGEMSLVNHFLFQRLRDIRQLGFSDQAFPSATHNRFSHSLGVCHLAGEAFDSIFNKNKSLLGEAKREKFRRAVKMAGLLHDIGHGPLSHSCESFMPPLSALGLENFLDADFKRPARHEDYGVKLIMDKEEGLYHPLLRAGFEPQALALLLHKEFSGGEDFFIEKGLNFLPLLRQIISSDFDVDRMDYLYRDSLHCGVKYGLIDFVWIIFHFDCHVVDNQVFLAIEREALYTLESLILGRQQMRLIVYFHHKSAIYNQMLKKYAEDSCWRLPASIKDYACFTDDSLFEQLKSAKNHWAERIVGKRPYLRLYERSFLKSSSEREKKPLSRLKQRLREKNMDFIEISSENSPLSPSSVKQALKQYPVYLKNKALNTSGELYKDPALLSFPERATQRIYVEPQAFSKAKFFLSGL